MTIKEFKDWLDSHGGGDDQTIELYSYINEWGEDVVAISFSETIDQWFFADDGHFHDPTTGEIIE